EGRCHRHSGRGRSMGRGSGVRGDLAPGGAGPDRGDSPGDRRPGGHHPSSPARTPPHATALMDLFGTPAAVTDIAAALCENTGGLPPLPVIAAGNAGPVVTDGAASVAAT